MKYELKIFIPNILAKELEVFQVFPNAKYGDFRMKLSINKELIFMKK